MKVWLSCCSCWAAGRAKQCPHTRLPYPGISRAGDLPDDVTTLIERLSTDQGDNEEGDDG